MAATFISIMIYLAALFLSSYAYFTDKTGGKNTKIIILIIVLIAALGGIYSEITKYFEEKTKDENITNLIRQDSILNAKYASLDSNYSKLNGNYTLLNNKFTDVNKALNISHLFYDSASKKIFSLNIGSIKNSNFGNIKNANLGNMSGGHIGDTYNKPPQRNLENDDLAKIISNIPSKNYEVKVTSNGSIESNTFRDEILKELSKLGYKKLVLSTISASFNTWGVGKFTIRKSSYGNEEWVEVLINPQE